jgi:hypothetical protein
MLVICLLAASFTGCLGSDDIVDEVPVEEQETIEPVGTGDNGGNETNNYYYNNDTYYVNGTDYLELISQVENLTVAVEELTHEVKVLTDAIEEMQSSKYDVPENSSIMIYDSHTYNHDDNEEQFYLTEKYEIIKSGNTITMEYLGPRTSSSHFLSTERNCTNLYPDITFVNGESDIILSTSGSYSNYMKRGFDIVKECEVDPDFEDEVNHKYEYWTTITITLPEEPVRFAFSSSVYAAASEIYTFS